MNIGKFFRQGGVQRNLIISFILMGLVPMFIMGSIFYYKSSDILLKNASGEMNNLTAKVIEQLDQDFKVFQMQMNSFVEPCKQVLSMMEFGLEIDEGNSANTRQYFQEFMKSNAYLKQFRFLNGEGNEKFNVNKEAMGKAKSVSGVPWFQKALASKDIIYSDVLISPDTNTPIIIMAKAFYNQEGKPYAVMVADLDAEIATKRVTDIKIGKSGYAFVVGKDGTVLANPDKAKTLKLNLSKYDFGKEILQKKKGSLEYDWEGSSRYASYLEYPAMSWIIVTTTEKSDILASVNTMKILFVILLVVMGVIAAVVGIFFSVNLVKPIRRIVAGLAEGADQVAAASGQVSSSSQQLAEGASEQASSLEETSSSLEEMSAMTKQNADNAGQAKAMMTEAKVVVEKANAQMAQLMEAIGQITRSSEETGKIIKTIDEIAFQTNLLALNAAVEAARAGEAGAGFAVVADEVRNLALRSAEAAKNTSDLIEKTIKAVKNGNEITLATQTAFKANADISGKIGQLVEEIATASQEQAHGIAQVNTAVSEMDRVTQQTAANAEESASAAEEMNAQAQQMRGYVEELAGVIGGGTSEVENGSAPKVLALELPEGMSERRKKSPRSASLGEKATNKVFPKPKKSVRPESLIPFGEDEKGTFKDF
jgi:methyl-accepting chemotaxis protein